MARSRNIKPGLTENEVLAELGPMSQLLFAALPCHADRQGRLEDRPRRLKAKIFPYYDADVDVLLQGLADCEERFIVRYEVEGKQYIQITNFDAHQSPHHKEPDSTIPEAPVLDPSKAQACVKHEPCIDQESANHDNLGAHAPVKGIRNQVKGIKDQESARPDPFEAFWEVVHLRKGKQGARTAHGKALRRLREENPDRDAGAFLVERMALFAASPEADPPDRSPIHPSTWLNDGRYDDDPQSWQTVRGSPASKPTKREIETAKFMARHSDGRHREHSEEHQPSVLGVRPEAGQRGSGGLLAGPGGVQ